MAFFRSWSSAGREQQQQQQSSSMQRNQRYTYPGQRAASSRHSIPTAPPRTGGSAPPVRITPSGERVVIRGSHVSASSAASASSQPSSTSSAAAAPPDDDFPSEFLTESATRPGAYAVIRAQDGPAQVFRVTVPAGVRPGSEFSVHAGSRRVRVRCPVSSIPGQSLQITLPAEPQVSQSLLRTAPLTDPTGFGGGGAVQMTQDVARVNQAAKESGGTAQTFLVTIPPNIYPGMQFTVTVEGQRFMVTCPANAGPNMTVRIVPPSKPEEPEAAPKTQVFEVVVPPGVKPHQPFTLMANGQRVLVTCPPHVTSGQKIRFQLPMNQAAAGVRLSYADDAGGWCRTVRVNDLKFQWVRVNSAKNETNLVEDMDGTFDFKKSAYVRKLTFLEGNDARMRTGTLELVPASDSVAESKLTLNNKEILSYSDIASIQGKSLDAKTVWFQNLCSQMTADWHDGHIKLCVRRRHILQDSVDAVMSLGREDMRKRWRLEFLGEPGIDAGGLAREWFQLVSEQIFDPDKGLWLSSVQNQMCMTINPASNISCPDDHLIYFRFLGRIMGRALFDRQIISGHLARHFYKHMLGFPVTFEDLEHQDEDYYSSLKKLTGMDDVSLMCLDFTATEETLGVRTEIELIEGGSMKEVTNENIGQYLEANLKYRMLDRTKPQLTEMLLGFFDVIPEPALTVFDFQELELLLCGLPKIEMEDWEANTNYSGFFESKKRRHKVVTWFWEVVRDDFDQEMKARLLQFVTGTSGVPARGFSVLQGNDGNIKKFTIHGVDTSLYVYPRAHTCFNRIDLPNYSSKKQLEEKLRAAITMSANGFDME